MGVRASGIYTYINDNYVRGNQHVGLLVNNSRSLVIRNRGENNGFNPIQALLDTGNDPAGNIIIDPSNTFGPIVDVSSSGDFINTLNADHPYANYEY